MRAAMECFANIREREARLTSDLKRAREDVKAARAQLKTEKRALVLERSQSDTIRKQRDEAREQLADADYELGSLQAEHEKLKADQVSRSARDAERLQALAKKDADIASLRAEIKDAAQDTTALRVRLNDTESELADVVASKALLEKNVTQRLQRKLDDELNKLRQNLAPILGGHGLNCSGLATHGAEPSLVPVSEKGAGEEATLELPVPAGPPTALAPASSSSDSSESEER